MIDFKIVKQTRDILHTLSPTIDELNPLVPWHLMIGEGADNEYNLKSGLSTLPTKGRVLRERPLLLIGWLASGLLPKVTDRPANFPPVSLIQIMDFLTVDVWIKCHRFQSLRFSCSADYGWSSWQITPRRGMSKLPSISSDDRSRSITKQWQSFWRPGHRLPIAGIFNEFHTSRMEL